MSVVRFLFGLLLFLAMAAALLYLGGALFLQQRAALVAAQAERLEAATMLQQTQTLDYLSRAQVGQSNRLWVALAVMMVIALAVMIGMVLVLLAQDRQSRQTVMYLQGRPTQQALPPAYYIDPQQVRRVSRRQEIER